MRSCASFFSASSFLTRSSASCAGSGAGAGSATGWVAAPSPGAASEISPPAGSSGFPASSDGDGIDEWIPRTWNEIDSAQREEDPDRERDQHDDADGDPLAAARRDIDRLI